MHIIENGPYTAAVAGSVKKDKQNPRSTGCSLLSSAYRIHMFFFCKCVCVFCFFFPNFEYLDIYEEYSKNNLGVYYKFYIPHDN